jgi:hypothetical protein
MKIMLLAAVAALSLGVGSAYADGNGQAETMFTKIPGVMPKTPAQIIPPVAATPSGQVTPTFVTSSRRGGYQFPAGANYESGSN